MSYIKLPKIRKPEDKTLNYKNIGNLKDLIEDKVDEEIIFDAIRVGYLLYPSREFIWSVFEKQTGYEHKKNQKLIKKKSKFSASYEEFENDYSKILFLNLSKAPLIEIGDIYLCKNIIILNLSNNYLINIEPLYECVNLLRLDLQNNQLSKIPDEDFWSRFKKLKLLYLHGNPIGKLEYLKYIAHCPNLEILTLYDTPLSLKNNYRHHTVNSIISLKALDDYVISDEEIIEEAIFSNCFAAKSEFLKIDLNISLVEDNSFKSELKATRELLKKVNMILAKYSPVLIVQKYIKGYLQRKKYYKMKQERRIKAAIKIQKWWRKIRKNISDKKLNNVKDKLIIKNEDDFLSNMNFSSSFFNDQLKKDKRNNTPSSANIKRNIIIDLNKLNKRQSFILGNTDNSKSLPLIDSISVKSDHKLENTNRLKPVITKQEFINNLFKDQRLDSEKLIRISQMVSNFNDSLYNSHISKDINYVQITEIIQEILSKKSKEASLKSDDKNDQDQNESNLDENLFRLPILKPDNSILKTKDKYIIDIVKEKYVGFNSIKKMEEDGHKQLVEIKKPAIAKQEVFLTNDQRFFQKIYGNMNLGSLKAVDKAYEERNLIDKLIERQKKTESLKENRKYSQRQIDYYKEDRIKEIQEKHINEKRLQKDSKKQQEKDLIELKREVREKRERMKAFKKRRQKDILLAIDFSKQHLSVSKALQKHEFITSKETNLKKRIDLVLDRKSKIETQLDMVKKFIEQRKTFRLIQVNSDKKIITERLKNDTETEQNKSKKRVEYLKSLSPTKYRQLEIFNFNFIPPDFYDYDFYENYLVPIEKDSDRNEIDYDRTSYLKDMGKIESKVKEKAELINKPKKIINITLENTVVN